MHQPTGSKHRQSLFIPHMHIGKAMHVFEAQELWLMWHHTMVNIIFALYRQRPQMPPMNIGKAMHVFEA